ncbi:MAG: GyrI-like domain-containing protein [Microlunatus sp.]|nr:GyrI-like domain-containing protein [Microlunatus sp.]
MSTYETTALPGLSLTQYTAQVQDQSEIPPVVGDLFGRLMPVMRQLEQNPDQPTIAWYDFSAATMSLGVGFPTTEVSREGATAAGLEIGELAAAARAVVTRHTGTLEGIQGAWADMHRHVLDQGLTPNGPCREIYVEGSMERPDSWVVDLQQPVA